MPLYKFPTNAIAGISGSSITTANVTEHTNLYFTNTRVYANVVSGNFTQSNKAYAFTRIF